MAKKPNPGDSKANALDSFEVMELDDTELEEVAGGVPTNGNCDCPSCPQPPEGFDNGNCSCCQGGGGGGEI